MATRRPVDISYQSLLGGTKFCFVEKALNPKYIARLKVQNFSSEAFPDLIMSRSVIQIKFSCDEIWSLVDKIISRRYILSQFSFDAAIQSDVHAENGEKSVIYLNFTTVKRQSSFSGYLISAQMDTAMLLLQSLLAARADIRLQLGFVNLKKKLA
ncbi:hypothetical protein X798_05723 [Onchocerca flexuosa]|uniref:Uncharacterized protein n=1 Tax=Onchocerca flexuosa TaxID=387005 RepID=A0A238BPT9_9BILA|nr:hypothetical protein X798_05723 [Onchocerca flexuosa]